MLPEDLHKFFWEHPLDTLDEDRHKAFVIERLLEHGDDLAVRWVFRRYARADILQVVCSSRRLSRKTANCWRNYFQLSEDDVLCLRKPPPRHSLHSWTG